MNFNILGIFGSSKPTNGSSDNYFKLVSLRHISSQTITPGILCITEIKLGKIIDDSEIDIKSYSIHRRDRNRWGGGVAIYYKDHLDAVPLDLTSTSCSMIEYAAVKLISWLKSILIACIFWPPKSKAEWMAIYYYCLDYLHTLKLLLIIINDFNFDLLADNSFAVNINLIYNLKQIINEPTRIMKSSSTLIDHISILHDIRIYNQGSFYLHLSDHQCTCSQINNSRSNSSQLAVSCDVAMTYGCTTQVNRGNLLKDLSLVPWYMISDHDTRIDEMKTAPLECINMDDIRGVHVIYDGAIYCTVISSMKHLMPIG